ncbi:hypothetical protein [Geobacter sp.]|uniref:hypothetical protein n=1 Tax=Geobacter sp. TaxID=46610 RepID=UPI0027B8D8DF|nr:hypothetical protein [Geobacter sp.]
MAIDPLHNRILGYFENEIDAARKQLKAGLFESFKDQVIAGRKIAAALELLTPYAQGDWRAQRLVKSGETLIQELLSVRKVIRKRSGSAHKRQLLLISQVMPVENYLH